MSIAYPADFQANWRVLSPVRHLLLDRVDCSQRPASHCRVQCILRALELHDDRRYGLVAVGSQETLSTR